MNYQLLIEKAKIENFTDIEIYKAKSSSMTLSIFNGEVDKTEIKIH
mgnify:FL=1